MGDLNEMYPNEAAFRGAFIGPLLTKLGYLLVTHSHGSDEQGRDFLFADYDRFDRLRIFAAQVKFGDIGTAARPLDELRGQIERAFRVKIRHRSGIPEQRIAALYIMSSGSISAQAREYLIDFCHSQTYGGNLHFLDGDDLATLDRKATFHDARSVLQQLSALELEARSNFKLYHRLRQELMDQTHSEIRFRRAAMDAFLASPSITNYFLERVDRTWSAVTGLNHALDMCSQAAIAMESTDLGFVSAALGAAEKAYLACHGMCGDLITQRAVIEDKFDIGVTLIR